MVKTDILSDIEKQDSMDEIDIMVSDSVETESKLIREQRLQEDKEKSKNNTPVENKDDQASQEWTPRKFAEPSLRSAWSWNCRQ
jgi:hypothetical protein